MPEDTEEVKDSLEVKEQKETTVDKARDTEGKAVPLQAWSAPEGSRKLRFPDFMTTAQDGS